MARIVSVIEALYNTSGERLLVTGATREKSSREKQRNSLGARRQDEAERDGANEEQSESRGSGRRGKSVPAWLMSRGMIDSPIRAMPGPYAFTCSLAPGFPYSPFSRHFSPPPSSACLYLPSRRSVHSPFTNCQNAYGNNIQ